MNVVFRKEIGKDNDRLKIMPINVDDTAVVIRIPIVVIDITTEIIIIPHMRCMEML